MILTIDFESYYSREYSLSRMSELEYALDPRFQFIMCSFKEDHGPTVVEVGEPAIRARLARIDWANTDLLCHHTRFDGSLLFWKFGHKPRRYLDTLSMARCLVRPETGKVSLKVLSDWFGLPPKGDEVVHAIGKRLEDFLPNDLAAYADYCKRDTDNTRALFDIMAPKLPESEFEVIDITLRMFIEPQVTLDQYALAAHLQKVKAERAAAFDMVSYAPKDVFSSNLKFAALLAEQGIEVPMKMSPTTGKLIPALAKNDREFIELREDPELPTHIQALCAARIGAKSTIEETRTQRVFDWSQVVWPGGVRGWLPVPLKVWGAHTGRASGDGAINMQNLKRTSGIKRGIVAPKGYRIVHRDSSQIEARVAAELSGCVTLADGFRQGRDVYCDFGSKLYRRLITKADELERFCCKVCILSLQFGVGKHTLRHSLFVGQTKADGSRLSMKLTEQEAGDIVWTYRREMKEIPATWTEYTAILDRMAARPGFAPETRGPVTFCKQGIWLPNGTGIAYPDLRPGKVSLASGIVQNQLMYRGAYGDDHYIWGGKCFENVVQALARIVVTDIKRRVFHETGYHPAFFTHDSLDYVVPESEVEPWDRYLTEQFAIAPAWMPALPLASDGGWGVTLMDAESHKNN